MGNPFVAPRAEHESLERVFHFFVDHDGAETGEYEEVVLAADGAVDLSVLRDQEQAHTWAEIGVRDEIGARRIYPADGVRFLKRLLHMNNQLWRYRRSA